MDDVSSPEKNDFHVDLTFSGDQKSYARPIGVAAAAVIIGFIVLTMTTNVASYILPMSDEYLQAMIPLAPDGGEPLALKTLDHEISEKTITVRGSVGNRTDYTVSGIRVVVAVHDTTGRFPQTLEIPAEPADIPPQGTSTFQATATLQEKPAGYTIKFRFADGPFVPHLDDRAATYGITGR